MQRGRCLSLRSCRYCMTLGLPHVGKFLTFAKPWSKPGHLQNKQKWQHITLVGWKMLFRTGSLIASDELWEKDAGCPEDNPRVFAQRKLAFFTMCGAIGWFLEFHLGWVQKLVIWDLVLNQVEDVRKQASSWIDLMQPLLAVLVLLYLRSVAGWCQSSYILYIK